MNMSAERVEVEASDGGAADLRSRLAATEGERTQAADAAERSLASEAGRLQAELGQLKAELARVQNELSRTAADLRRTEIVLAEERRANLGFRAQADVAGQLVELRELIHRGIIQHGVGVRGDQMVEIAKEVWWERNRRTLPYKAAKMLKRLTGASTRATRDALKAQG
jgi:hypothetical protein